MKKLLVSLALLVLSFAASAQIKKIDALIEKYQGTETFTSVMMPGSMLGLSEEFTDSEVPQELLDSVSMMYVLVQEAPTNDYLDQVNSITKSLKVVMNVNSGGEKVTMYCDKDGKMFVIAVNDGEEHVLVVFNGEALNPEQFMTFAAEAL